MNINFSKNEKNMKKYYHLQINFQNELASILVQIELNRGFQTHKIVINFNKNVF